MREHEEGPTTRLVPACGRKPPWHDRFRSSPDGPATVSFPLAISPCLHPVAAVRKGWIFVSCPWRAIVVDDNPQLLKMAARLLASIPGVEVIGEATSGEGALEAVDRLQPNLVLMDITMPGMDGLEATRQLAARSDAPAVILMTVHDLPQYRDAALAAGARQFVIKSDLVVQLGPTILSLLADFEADSGEKSA
jgi:CheY-like chemotaxis protein